MGRRYPSTQVSLNKAFSAAGGIVALPTREDAGRIRRCGGPMLFSGPIQPPMFGAAVGSARLHVSAGFEQLQTELLARVDAAVAAVTRRELKLVTAERTPIFQVECDSPRIAFKVVELLLERGFLGCICVFPAVPMNRPGVRFTVSRHNDLGDVEPFVAALEDCLERGKHQSVAAAAM